MTEERHGLKVRSLIYEAVEDLHMFDWEDFAKAAVAWLDVDTIERICADNELFLTEEEMAADLARHGLEL